MKTYRSDFPFFHVNSTYAYLDSAATTQKPEIVVRSLYNFYAYEYATAQRSMYSFAEEATRRYEEARRVCAHFIGAADASEILFTKGATESINTVVQGWASRALQEGDEIILSRLEHNANIIPWLMLAQQKDLVIIWWDFDQEGYLSLAQLEQLITSRTKLIALTGYSNVLGAIAPDTVAFLTQVVARAHASNIRVLIDGAQLVPHMRLDLQAIDCDFLVFSGHKMLGPQGVGVLYVPKRLHAELHPYQMGGGMFASWAEEGPLFHDFPRLYEAGTQAVAQVIAFGQALTYLEALDFTWLKEHESRLCRFLRERLERLKNVHILSPLSKMIHEDHLISFTIKGIHPHDVAAYLDTQAVAVRAGKQCADQVHDKLGIDASIRASFYVYSIEEDCIRLLDALERLLACL